MTEKILNDLQWADFTIMKHDNTNVLVLLYEDEVKGQDFLKHLHSKEFDLIIGTEQDKYFVEITFIKSDMVIRIVSTKTEETHKLMNFFTEGLSYIATGHLDKTKLPTRYVLFDTNLKNIQWDLDTFLNSLH